MGGQQHNFPGFQGGSQQQNPMRSQFGPAPGQLPPQMNPAQQAALISQQAYGIGMPNIAAAAAAAVAAQQQHLVQQHQQQQQQLHHQQLQQLQQHHQQQQQLQQMQHQQVAQMTGMSVPGGGQPMVLPMGAAPLPGASQIPPNGHTVPGGQIQSQPPSHGKEFNTASLCRFGQETVQDIVSRTQEVFQALKSIVPPNGTMAGIGPSHDKKNKVQEQLKTIKLHFKRLRWIYDRCNENCQGMEYTHIESLIPFKEEWDPKSEEKKSSESYRLALEESKEMTEQVILKNRHLKEIIDHLRRIIWEINTMLSMRRS